MRHINIRNIFVIIILLCIPMAGLTKEQPVNFIYVDTASYNAYLNKDWKRVVEVAKLGLKHDIDYYYLRMRVGIAQYERYNYKSAIPHFLKALEFNNSDTIAEKYVYYAYTYLGDDINAVSWLSQLKSDWAVKQLAKKQLFENVFAFYSQRFYDNKNLDSATIIAIVNKLEDNFEPIYTEQSIDRSYRNYQFGGSLRLSPVWRAEISYQNFQIVQEQEVVDPFRMITSENSIKQTQWNINNTIKLGQKLKASIYFTYLKYSYDYIDIVTENNPVQYNEVKGEEESDFLFGIGFERHQTLWDVNLSSQFLTNINGLVWQSDLGLNFYPMGNLNLWTRSKLSFLKQDSNTKFIFKQAVHYKPFNRGEFALSACWGDLRLWSDRSGYAVYNGAGKLSSLYQISLTLRLVNKLYFKAYYEYMSNTSAIMSKSLLPEEASKPEKEIETNQFNIHSIIGGLIWEF